MIDYLHELHAVFLLHYSINLPSYAFSTPRSICTGRRPARSDPPVDGIHSGRRAIPDAAGRYRKRKDLHHGQCDPKSAAANPGDDTQQNAGGAVVWRIQAVFPENAVGYFVSYYDYYQPEAYIPHTNTYIEKDLSINEELDKLRLQATAQLLSGRRDIIVVASVSCIYGMGNPTEYENGIIRIHRNQVISRQGFLHALVNSLYHRSQGDFERGSFRVKGDTVDINLPYVDFGYRISFWR